jgi:hypothetical protein
LAIVVIPEKDVRDEVYAVGSPSRKKNIPLITYPIARAQLNFSAGRMPDRFE